MSPSDSETVSFSPATEIDPNVWYQVSEARVDKYTSRPFKSSFQVLNSTSGDVVVWPENGNLWQFHRVPSSSSNSDDDKDDGARYFIRSSVTSTKKQLSVCFDEEDQSNGKTKPCLADSNGSDEQQWAIANWGNDMYRLINVRNGSDYWLDVHEGNPPFMGDEIDLDVYQPAQRWLLSSVSDVDDGGYSTVFSNLPRTASASTTRDASSTSTSTYTSTSSSEPTGGADSDPSSSSGANSDSDSGSGGIPVGTAVGVGVGVGLGLIVLAALAFFLWRRRRRTAVNIPSQPPSYAPIEGASVKETDKPVWSGSFGHEHYAPYSNHSSTPAPPLDGLSQASPPVLPSEMPGESNVTHEIDSGVHQREIEYGATQYSAGR